MLKQCKKCNQLLDVSNFTKSKNVKDGYENTCKKCRNKQRIKYTKICIICNNEFETISNKSRYCNKCKPQCQRKRKIVNCSICGKEKEVTLSRYKMHKDFYCSDKCKNKGYSLKYSGINSMRYNKQKTNCDFCGKEIIRNKYELDNYSKHFCSNKCRYKAYPKMFSGKNNPNYNPSKNNLDRILNRNIDGYQDFIRKTYERDDFTCKCCGDNKGGNLNAHHIFNYMEYPELRLSLENSITLCSKCHKLFHDTYGYTKNNNYQLKEFLICQYQAKLSESDKSNLESLETNH